ncbi:MAG TPA: hypothetical protein VF698_09300 [Thermoanaerobaculia bacterium]
MRRLLCLTLLAAAACASNDANRPAPAVTLVQTSAVPDLTVASVSGVPTDYRLLVENPFDHPVTLVSVEIESVGDSGAYAMKRVRHSFDRTIAAKSSDSVDLRAWVQRLQVDSRGDSDQPVLLRGSARFDTPVGPMRRNFVTRAQ